MEEPSKPLSSRRRFLWAATAGTVAATAAALRGTTPASKTTTAETGAATGYRLTEHVRNYYRTTQV